MGDWERRKRIVRLLQKVRERELPAQSSAVLWELGEVGDFKIYLRYGTC